MKRPLLVVVVGYIIGIVWGLYCNCSIALLYAIISIFYILHKLFQKSNKKLKLFSFKRYLRYIKIYLKFSTICIIIISSFVSNIIIQNQNNKYNNLYSSVDNLEVVGVIISNAQEKEYTNSYKIRVESINNNLKYKNTNLIVKVKKNTNVKYGDKVEIKGKFIAPQTKRNYKGFDYKEFLKTQKIYGTVNVSNVKVLKENCNKYILSCSNKAFLMIKQNINKVLPQEYSSLMIGIMLGETDNIDENTIEDFRNSNMVHILAVSGMHVMYVIAGTITIFKLLLRQKEKQYNGYFGNNSICIYYRIFTIYCACFNNGSNNARR